MKTSLIFLERVESYIYLCYNAFKYTMGDYRNGRPAHGERAYD